MAQYTKHPVAAPPTAPERESTGHLLLRGYAILVIVVAFAHAAIYDLIGPYGAGAVTIILALSAVAIGVPMIARARSHPFPWRRLPWSALGYVCFALLFVAWSQWRGPSFVAWFLLAAVTVNALLIAYAFSWYEIARALASAFKWLLGLSLVLELWTSIVHDTLLDGGRIQGIVGNSTALAVVCLFGTVAFGIQLAMRARWRTTLMLWTLLAVYLMFRASSATAYICAIAAAIVLGAALLVRRTRTPRERTRIYLACGVGVVVVIAGVFVFRTPLFEALGRSANLTGRSDAHNMWLDVLLQLGAVGLLLMAAAYFGLLWRAWFFAADRPRWDLRADRPYSPLTLLPLLFTVILLVYGLAESTPTMLWGWLLLVLFSFKVKSVPLVSAGLSELSRVTERGQTARRIP